MGLRSPARREDFHRHMLPGRKLRRLENLPHPADAECAVQLVSMHHRRQITRRHRLREIQQLIHAPCQTCGAEPVNAALRERLGAARAVEC